MIKITIKIGNRNVIGLCIGLSKPRIGHYKKSKLESKIKAVKMKTQLFAIGALRSRAITIVDEGEEDHE